MTRRLDHRQGLIDIGLFKVCRTQLDLPIPTTTTTIKSLSSVESHGKSQADPTPFSDSHKTYVQILPGQYHDNVSFQKHNSLRGGSDGLGEGLKECFCTRWQRR
jgi:hypothetical protein